MTAAGTDPLVDDVAARVLLARLAEPGDTRVHRAVADLGAVGLVDRIVTGTGDDLQVYRARLPRDRTPAEGVAADLAELARLDGRLVLPGQREWPTQLDDLGERAPVLLWVRGAADLRLAALRSVAIVGSRSSSPYGDRVASDLGAGLAERGWAVVSGGAYGIDAAAHRGALAVDGVSVAVLACGVDVAYPRGHDGLFSRLLVDGVVMTEAAPGAPPYRGRFLVRNRVIAALSRGTVVVEAALRSGSLATAREAGELGRVVMGVPGPVTSTMSAGVHGALRDGALLVTTVEEVVEAVGDLGADLAPVRRGAETTRDQLDPIGRRVLDALPTRGAADTATIAAPAGVDQVGALAALGLLELGGFVRRDRDGWRLAGAHRATS
jgi:DNA processing protein